jgi:hypothetical protein
MTVPWPMLAELARLRQRELLAEADAGRLRREARKAAREARKAARAARKAWRASGRPGPATARATVLARVPAQTAAESTDA